MVAVFDLDAEPQTEAALVALTHALAVSLGPPDQGELHPSRLDRDRRPAETRRPREERHSPRDRDRPLVGRPEDIAAWLAWDEEDFVTSRSFLVDGAMSVRMVHAN